MGRFIERACVFCGSSSGSRASYARHAQELGRALAERQFTLIYGGGRVGLMGTIADAALARGGKVIGVIPRALSEREVAHEHLSELHVVHSMHERKARMADLAQAFIGLPGGFGTLEEFCEVLTWAQLRLHSKPCLLLNVDGYYDPLLAFLDHAVREGFVHPEHRQLVSEFDSIEALLDSLEHFEAPAGSSKWIAR